MTIQILTPQITIVITIIKITITIDTKLMIDIVAIVENIRKTTIDQILDKDITIDLEVRIDLDLMIIIKEELHLDLHIDLHTEITQITDITPRSRYRSRSQSQGNSFKRYIYPYRSPSRPRDFRSRSRTPSRNRQQNRINQVDVKSTKDNDSTKFEIHTCQITEIANTITPYLQLIHYMFTLLKQMITCYLQN